MSLGGRIFSKRICFALRTITMHEEQKWLIMHCHLSWSLPGKDKARQSVQLEDFNIDFAMKCMI